jgi:hypothetical protein
MITMEEKTFKDMLSDCFEIGLKKGMIVCGQLKPYLKKSEAYKQFGRTKVESWISKGLVTEIKDGDGNSNIRIDRMEIEKVASTSNRASYITKS